MVFLFSISTVFLSVRLSFPVYGVFYVLTVSGLARVSELLYTTTRLSLCQQLFYSFLNFFLLLSGRRAGIRRPRRVLLASTVIIISSSAFSVNYFFCLFLKVCFVSFIVNIRISEICNRLRRTTLSHLNTGVKHNLCVSWPSPGFRSYYSTLLRNSFVRSCFGCSKPLPAFPLPRLHLHQSG